MVVYASRTGNVRRFIAKTKLENVLRVDCGNEVVSEPYILVTYTASYGSVPINVSMFLKKNSDLMVGVAGSGNRNWGDLFCRAVDLIVNKYKVKEILRFELSGNFHDVSNFVKVVEEFN